MKANISSAQFVSHSVKHLKLFTLFQKYENEESVGKAIKASGVPREELYITTKYALGDIRQVFRNSLLSVRQYIYFLVSNKDLSLG